LITSGFPGENFGYPIAVTRKEIVRVVYAS